MFIHDQIVNSGTLSEPFREATFAYAKTTWNALGLTMSDVIWLYVAA